MAEALAPHVDAREEFSASDRMVARLLAEVLNATSMESVRKTTLAALVAAFEEQVNDDVLDPETYRVAVSPLGGSGLTDALLHLRSRGLVRLTDSGFQLTEPGSSLAEESDAGRLTEFLSRLVSMKFQEWQLTPRLA